MVCVNQKSALYTVNSTTQTLAANGYIEFANNNLLTGIAITHLAGSTSIGLTKGLYMVTANADVTPTAAGDIAVQLVNNGVVVSGAKGSVTGASDTMYSIGFTTLVKVLPSCCVINNNASLQVQLTAAGGVSNASMSVVKLA